MKALNLQTSIVGRAGAKRAIGKAIIVPSSRPAPRPSVAVGARRADSPIMPVAVPVGPKGEEEMVGLMEYLLRNRIIFLGSRIGEEVANRVVASLMALELIDDKSEIKIYINSTGASSYAALSIVDVMRHMKAPISTVAFGMVASSSVLVLAAGTKGRRFSMPNARLMIHQPQGGSMGSADEVNIQATELNRTMQVIQRMYAEYTGLPLERIEEETDRDNFLTPKEALELGIIDGIITAEE